MVIHCMEGDIVISCLEERNACHIFSFNYAESSCACDELGSEHISGSTVLEIPNFYR